MRWFFLTAFLFASPAMAQDPNADPKTAAINLGLAVKLCLAAYRLPSALPDEFRQAGFTVAPGLDANSFEFDAHGVVGVFQTTTGYCLAQTAVVPLETTQPFIKELSETLFPGMVELGAPEGGNGPCDGLSIFAPQKMIRVSYSATGNSGDCLFDGTSAVIIR